MAAGLTILTHYVFVLGQRRTAGGKEGHMVNFFAQFASSTAGGVMAAALTQGFP